MIPLEIIESVDMMRIIEHGYMVKMIFCHIPTCSVDTVDDLARIERLMENDPLIVQYSQC